MADKANKMCFSCQKVIENKAYRTLFSSVGIGLHQWICKVIGIETDAQTSVSQPVLLSSPFWLLCKYWMLKWLWLAAQDSDIVALICVCDLTQNFILHCSCPFQQEKLLQSFDWWRVGRSRGQNIRKLGKLSGPLEMWEMVLTWWGCHMAEWLYLYICLYYDTYILVLYIPTLNNDSTHLFLIQGSLTDEWMNAKQHLILYLSTAPSPTQNYKGALDH